MDTNTMDRPLLPRKRRVVPALIAAGAVIAAAFAGRELTTRPRGLHVERATLTTDVVRAGELLVQVHGGGTLVAKDVRWLSARTAGRVERVVVDAGGAVSTGTIILELSNPEAAQRAAEAALALRATEAEAVTLAEQWASQVLTQQAEVAAARAALEEARIRADVDRTLASEGVLPSINSAISEGNVRQLQTRYDVARAKLTSAERMRDATAQQQRARLEQQRALQTLRAEEAAALRVRAGIDGVVQRVAVESGQQVAAGAALALVADPRRLEARLLIPETQAKDVRIGQNATIDTRVGVVRGFVARVDAASVNGNVAVDVRLETPLPPGARPDLNVDGTIDVARIAHAIHAGRPAIAPSGAASVFRLTPDGSAAIRVPVTFGRISSTRVEVLRGLAPGDVIVTSDTTEWDGFDRIALD